MNSLADPSIRREMQANLAFEARKKSVAGAYVLWLFLGLLGAHRFYLGRTGSAVIMFLLSLSVVGLVLTVVWFVVDAFLIPRLTEDRNEEIRYLISI